MKYNYRVLVAGVALTVLMTAMNTVANAQETSPSPFISMDEIGSVDAQVDAFLKERGWQLGECSCNPAGGTLVIADAPISSGPELIEFSKARLIATDEAFLTAMGEFARQDSVEIAKTSTRTLMKDDLPREIASESDLGTVVDAIAKRMATASVEKLNNFIEGLGGNTDDLPQLSFAERKQRLRDELLIETLSRSSTRLAGVGVFGVIENTGGNGQLNNGSVSVIVVRAPGFEDLGRQLRRGEDSAALGIPAEEARKKLAGHLAAGTPMLGYFGVQPIRDEQGRYGLMSFGMAGPQLVRGAMNEDDISTELEISKMSANMMAEGWLAQFANMAVSSDRKEIKRKLREKVDVFEFEGQTRQESSKALGSMLNAVTKTTSRARISGIQELGRWQTNAPDTGHPYVGVVKYWSPNSAAASARLRDAYQNGTSSTATTSQAPAQKKKVPASTRVTGAFGEW